MDERTFTTLELEALIGLLAGYVQSPLGRARALSLRPSTDPRHIERELDITAESVNLLRSGGGLVMSELADPDDALAQLRIMGASLDPHQILLLQSVIAASQDVRGQFTDPERRAAFPTLSAIAAGIPDLRRLLASIRGKILPNGEIDDNASPELRRIRRDISERRNRIYRSLESLMRDRVPGAIQDDIVTMRNGRYVIPVRSDARGQVPGVMHGLSSSGQTTYVEPLATIDQNNELVRLRELEEIEIANILASITQALRDNLPGIESLVGVLAEFDFAQAKARMAVDFQCVRPALSEGRRLMLREARHPLLEHLLRRAGGRVVPISLELDEAHQTMVISGPNAGGKTVVVKTVGLIALMAQMGLHVPAADAALPVFEQVLADIGDQQSIQANLSTFTAHMRNIAEMAERVAPPALILIDEVGTGTDPDEGAALGVAIVDYFREAGATTIATTHYNPLKVWASQTPGVLNASVEFDEKTLRPTYRLLVGVAGASSGIEIARRMDVPASILSRAESLVDPAQHQASDYLRRLKSLVDEQEGLRAALEEERQATAEKYTNLDLEFARREAERQAEFERQLAEAVREFAAESERLMQGLKDRVAAARLRKDAEARAAELRRAAGARLRKQAADAPATEAGGPAAPAPASAASALIEEVTEIRERDRVRIRALDQEGVVESINDGVYTVLVGSLRFRARREELHLVKSAAPPASKRAAQLPRGVSATVSVDENFAPEINLLGVKADEARERVDKFLDEAFLAGADRLRIVHGHGTGVLRRVVAELLGDHPHVAKYYAAPANEGGAGATIVELRR